jgi:hypothetical protein
MSRQQNKKQKNLVRQRQMVICELLDACIAMAGI